MIVLKDKPCIHHKIRIEKNKPQSISIDPIRHNLPLRHFLNYFSSSDLIQTNLTSSFLYKSACTYMLSQASYAASNLKSQTKHECYMHVERQNASPQIT